MTLGRRERIRVALADGAAIVVAGMRPADPTGYGRLVMQDGQLIAIREERDASEAERAIGLCQTHTLASIAFPAISTGIYGFPADRAARIAVSTTAAALPAAPALRLVIFCCFSTEAARLHAQAMAEFGSPCAE